MNAQPSGQASPETTNLDGIFESAQRAHAVISLLIDACSTPAYGDDIVYSLWTVEREVREIKEATILSAPALLQEGSENSEVGGAE